MDIRYFPSQDGPSHLENANIIREYNHPDRAIFREYYSINKTSVANWLLHLILAGLISFAPVLVAEKILLSGYIVMFPLSVRYAIGATKPNATFISFMSFPFICNFLFHMGFYSFSYSLPMFFLTMGFWLKYRENLTVGKILILALLSLLTYFFHIVSLIICYIGMALITFFDIVMDTRARQIDLAFLWKVLRRRVGPLFFALLPTIFFLMAFLSQQGIKMSYGTSFLLRLKQICVLYSLCSYDLNEVWPSLALACLFAIVISLILVSRIRKFRLVTSDMLLFVAFVYMLVYFIAPNTISGGGALTPRLLLYPFFVLILWLGAQSYRKAFKRNIVIASVGIALIFLGLHAKKYAELNTYIDEYLSGMHLVKSNTTLLPLCFSHFGHSLDGQKLSRRVAIFLHISSYIAVQRGVVQLDNYEAFGCGYFPLTYKPSLNPVKHIAIHGGIENIPPEVDFLSYPKRTGRHVDYILLFGDYRKFIDHQATKSIFEQLEQGYDLIYSSSNKGQLHLYSRKGL